MGARGTRPTEPWHRRESAPEKHDCFICGENFDEYRMERTNQRDWVCSACNHPVLIEIFEKSISDFELRQKAGRFIMDSLISIATEPMDADDKDDLIRVCEAISKEIEAMDRVDRDRKAQNAPRAE